MKVTLCKSCEFSNICRTGKDSLNESKVKILGCSRYEKRQIKTNADKIRSMTDEELVSVLACLPTESSFYCAPSIACDECILNWLKQDAKE